MRRNSLLAGVGIASFVLFVIARIPAATVMPASIRTNGVTGTIWSGHVRLLDSNGWQLRDTHWDLHPAALLLGRLSASIATRVANSKITANASISLSGTLSVRDLEVAGPLVPMAAKFNLPVSGGRYQLRLSALDITDAWPTTLVGSARVTGVPLTIMDSGSGPTGNYAVVFNSETVPQDGRLSGTLSDDGGPVEVIGSIVLTPPTNYALQAQLKARPGAPAEITQALSFTGPAGADGRHQISMTGAL